MNAPEILASAAARASSMLAEGAAFDALPLSRAEVARWATLIEGGLEDLVDDWQLARDLCAGLPADVARPIRAIINAPAAACEGACLCLCGHTCAEHDLGGGRCAHPGCRCSTHTQHTEIAQAFASAEVLLRGAELPRAAEARERPHAERDTLPDVDEASPVSERRVLLPLPRAPARLRVAARVTLAAHFMGAARSRGAADVLRRQGGLQRRGQGPRLHPIALPRGGQR